MPMNRMNTLTHIKSLYPEMTASEKGIADFILDYPEHIYDLNIQELARTAKVSIPTVTRFAKRLDFEGFKDFKIALVRDISVGYHFQPDDIEAESVEEVTRNVFRKQISIFSETVENLDFTSVERAARAILEADRVLFFSVSSSNPATLDCFWKLSMAGFTCVHSTDLYTQEIIAENARKGDAAVCISFSGRSREVVECMKKARDNGAETICITSFIDSPLTKYSNIKLFSAPVAANYQQIDLPSKLSHMAIFDSIYLYIILKGGAAVSKSINKNEANLLKHRMK